MNKLFSNMLTSLNRCKIYIISVFIVYCISCLTGIIMVQTDNSFALAQRDKIIDTISRNDKASLNYKEGNHFTAALYDCEENLLASVKQTFLGLGVVFPYFTVSYQGWIGGLVSVDNSHKSRFKKLKPALYYFIVILLQFIAYSISIGAGVKTGVELYKQNKSTGWKIWQYKIRKENLLDVVNIYMLSIPIFFTASLFEFLSSWNI